MKNKLRIGKGELRNILLFELQSSSFNMEAFAEDDAKGRSFEGSLNG